MKWATNCRNQSIQKHDGCYEYKIGISASMQRNACTVQVAIMQVKEMNSNKLFKIKIIGHQHC